MTQPASALAIRQQVPLNEALDRYKIIGLVASVVTGICTLLNPITGAAVGTYAVTHIATNVLADMLGWNDAGTIGKIAKFVLPYLAASVATLGLLSVLGVVIPLTPAGIGGLIGATACLALSATFRTPS